MIATRLKGTVTEDRRLEVKLPRSVRPGEVDVILIREPQESRRGRSGRTSTPRPACGAIGRTLAKPPTLL